MNNIYPFNSTVGFGTSGFGRIAVREKIDTDILLMALETGYTVFDTAEQYSAGKSEVLLGRAIRRWGGDRSKIQIVSKLLPINAVSKENVIKHFKASLDRLQLEYIDVYLLHWYLPTINMPATVEAFLELKRQGLIKDIGLSNFNGTRIIQQWKNIELSNGVVPGSKEGCTILQTKYNITERALDKFHNDYNLTIMAHSPFALGNILSNPQLNTLASAEGITVSQLCIAWILRRNNTMTIPKSSTKAHMQENLIASNIVLSQNTINEIDVLFPWPTL